MLNAMKGLQRLEPDKFRGLAMMSAMRGTKKIIQELRVDAKVVANSLKAWQVAGRCFVLFRKFAQRIVRVQRWWRSVAKHLHEVLDRINKRFMALEKADLMRKLGGKASSSSEGRRSTTLSLEDKIALERVEEPLRLKFIENDLRARRYNLLPQIYLWEAEVRQWHLDYQEWQSANEAHKAMGTGSVSGFFRWPPNRPSCIPRESDEEIMEMVRVSRRNPKGWTKMIVEKPPVKVPSSPGQMGMGNKTGRDSRPGSKSKPRGSVAAPPPA